ncbi:MAG: glycosyltransferase family 2 protein [Patescibacteria group bacterium]|nr:glycosyltransferase family 2 protein [Patescibacteria group bacterium]
MDISIVIVNYKSKSLTLKCLESIVKADWPGLDYEIIVVDNFSVDLSSADLKPFGQKVKYIMNGRNLGYGAANNQGIRQAQGEYVVIMNPDTAAKPEAFFKLFDYMEKNPRVGLAGPKQFYPDGAEQDTCFRWPKLFTPLYRRTPLGRIGAGRRDLDRFLYKEYNKSSIKEVDWLLGSFLFCRAQALRQAGAFDEKFFLYFEDTDLCKRLWNMGWKVVYHPGAEIFHDHKRQSASAPWYKFFLNITAWHHLASWVRYIWKWRGK